MNLLVLGGTKFVGRHAVAEALARGHDVTLFTRGETNPDLFPEARHVRGDRNVSLAGLPSPESFDAVLDTSGYHPRPVGASARAFEQSLYCYISSVSAYGDLSKLGVTTEASPLASLPGPVPDEFDQDLYGGLKALSEKTVGLICPRSLIIRPGLIVGPNDSTDRFTYWPVRAARGGRILAAGPPDRGVQVIDVRDLATWLLNLLEQQATGVYNAVSQHTIGSIIQACQEAADVPSEIVWASGDQLARHGVEEWIQMPLWVREDGEYAGLLASDLSKAQAAGLRSRPMVQTARDTLDWFRSERGGVESTLKAGMSPRDEARIIKALSR